MARAAVGRCGTDYMVAGREPAHLRSHLLDDSRRFMTEDERQWPILRAEMHRAVGVADT